MISRVGGRDNSQKAELVIARRSKCLSDRNGIDQDIHCRVKPIFAMNAKFETDRLVREEALKHITNGIRPVRRIV